MARPAREVPSPPGHFLWGHLRERRRDALGLFLRGAEDYGPIVRHDMKFFQSFLLSDPAFIKHVLQDNHANYKKGPIAEKVEVLIGKGLATSEGEFWRKQRRMVQPVFQRRLLPEHVPLIHEVLDAHLAVWDARSPDEPFDLHDEMTVLTMNIICGTLFGRHAIPRMKEVSRAGLGFIDEVSREVLSIFSPRALLLRRRARPGPATLALHAIIADLIREHRKRPEGGEDFLSRMMRSRDEQGQPMSERQLLDEVLTLFVAGHETTAISLTWTLHLLATEPDAQEKLARELTSVLSETVPAAEDLSRLPYTRAVVRESMRLYPPLWSLPRQAIGDDEIGGFVVPRGLFVVLSPYVMQRLSRYWREPARFMPERFSTMDEERSPYVYFPFGAGMRRCAGYYFALLEMELIVARLLRRFRIESMPGPAVRALPLFTLKPDRPILLRSMPRTASTFPTPGAPPTG